MCVCVCVCVCVLNCVCVCVCVCVCMCSKFPLEVLSDEAVMQLLSLSALRMEHMQVGLLYDSTFQ